MPRPSGRLAAAVISYNTRELLRTCLTTLVAADPDEVVVVDNGSRDGSVEMVRAEFPAVTLVLDPANRGYGAACNLAVRHTTAEYVLLLNSDTEVEPEACRALARYLDAHPEVAVAGPRLRNADGSLQRSCFPFPSPFTQFLHESHLMYAVRLVPFVRGRHPRTWAHDRPRAVPWVLGAALAVRRTAFEAVGGFDEGFFMYFEEVDLCWRLAAAGWQVHFAPVTDVRHVGGASTAELRAAMLVHFYESMARFYRLHHSRRDLRRLRAIVRTRVALSLAHDRLRLPLARGAERQRLADRLVAWRRLRREPWTEPRP